jgi:hypothetical protein
MAGACLPDWLRMAARRARLPSHPQPSDDDTEEERELIAGVLKHHDDDGRFHVGATFVALSSTVAREVRAMFPGDRRLRASALAHILIEMLLDDALAARDPTLLPRFYEALDRIDGVKLEGFVARFGVEAPMLPLVFARFRSSRFLAHYKDDAAVAAMLERVLGSVGHPPLPDRIVDVIAPLRRRVRDAADALLGGA